MSDQQRSNDSNRGGGRSGDGDNRSRDSRSNFRRSRPYFRKKVCRFCTQGLKISYRDPDSVRRFLTERGKILPRRITGNCAKHQRALALEVKRARSIALLPYSKN